MIIELSWYEPTDGRSYESPVGGSISAIESYRIDCVECRYTKFKFQQTDKPTSIVSARFGVCFPATLPGPDVSKRQWYEAIYVRYRCVGDVDMSSLLAIGYRLTVYGTGNNGHLELVARLGPVEQEDEHTI